MRESRLVVPVLAAGFIAACTTPESEAPMNANSVAAQSAGAGAASTPTESAVQVPDGTWVTPDGATTITFRGNEPRSYFHEPANYRPPASALRRSGDVVQVGAGTLTIMGVSNGRMSGIWRMGGQSGSRTYILQ